jgi:hypothetical protein
MQFARFLPALRAQGATVTLFAPVALERLLRHSFPGVTVVAAENASVARPDCWASLVMLAGLFGATVSNLPSEPYLATPQRWQGATPGFKVGLVTAGKQALANDARRSLGEEQADSLRARLPGSVYLLDPAVTGARDFADTAAIVNALDLVVSVDTAVGHLAGALGKPTLLLLPGLGTDWRWMRGTDRSPWYPRHRLYRSGLNGAWDAVLDRVVADAHALATEGALP